MACGEDTTDEGATVLEEARREVLAAVGMQPLANGDEVSVGSTRSKSAPRYLTATGRLAGSVEEVSQSLGERGPARQVHRSGGL